MKKNLLYWAFLALPLVVGMTACDDDNEPNPNPNPEPTTTFGAYIVNTGNWGSNDGSIQWYNMETKAAGSDLYAAQNGRGIGDLQDLCVYGSKLYALSTTSSKLEVLDLKGKVLKSIPLTTDGGQPKSPRYAISGDGFIYFTSHDGTVSKLDTLSLSITKSVEVGDYPEALSYVNGKLYVNISGLGLRNKVAVVDAKEMTKRKDITVKLNPYTQSLVGADGCVYVVSNGNYAGTPGTSAEDWVYQTLQRIDPATDTVEELCNASYIAHKGGKIYILYAEYFLPDTRKCSVFDLKTKEETLLPISLDEFSAPGFIQVDPVTEDIYIGNQPSNELSSVSVYDKDGNFKHKFTTGMFTTNIRFVAE